MPSTIEIKVFCVLGLRIFTRYPPSYFLFITINFAGSVRVLRQRLPKRCFVGFDSRPYFPKNLHGFLAKVKLVVVIIDPLTALPPVSRTAIASLFNKLQALDRSCSKKV